MLNSNISSLFSSLGNNNVSSSIDYSTYTSIKSGSYKKLLKAYYSQSDDTKTDKSTSSSKTQKSNKAETSEAGKLTTEAKALKDTIGKLSDKDLWKEGDDARSKIISSVKQFASDYNDVISRASNVKSSDVSKSANWMKSQTNVMSNTLGRAGISVGVDGSISVDEDKMKKADLSTIKSLFTGTHSYADEISSDAASIASAATRSTSLYQSNGTLLNPVTSFFDQGF